ncbi:MAG: aldo/keto reductase [Planctomycetes bacterium]|nr:aldo/keto reductase [Planctomycetota bacterium]
MRTVRVSRIDQPLPAISQGTWNMGNHRRDRDVESAALRLGIELGMTLIDTAEMYASGGAEEVVAAAIAGQREKVFVESKVLPGNASRQGTIKACEASLKRLGIETLDLYLLHWPGAFPLQDTIAAFEQLVQAGKIRCWGVSNFDTAAMEEVERIAPGRCACNQVLYNLASRGVEWDLIAWCEQRGVLLQAYSPLAEGALPWKKLEPVAEPPQLTAAQVALAWCTRDKGVQAIPKSANPQRVRENAAAADVTLTSQVLAELDALFPPPKGPTPLDTA